MGEINVREIIKLKPKYSEQQDHSYYVYFHIKK